MHACGNHCKLIQPQNKKLGRPPQNKISGFIFKWPMSSLFTRGWWHHCDGSCALILDVWNLTEIPFTPVHRKINYLLWDQLANYDLHQETVTAEEALMQTLTSRCPQDQRTCNHFVVQLTDSAITYLLPWLCSSSISTSLPRWCGLSCYWYLYSLLNRSPSHLRSNAPQSADSSTSYILKSS